MATSIFPTARRSASSVCIGGLLLLMLCSTTVTGNRIEDEAEKFFNKGHTNNWAVLVCTSRFWFNYRHVANALSIYHSVKRLGIPDSQIILMIADDMACNARNPRPAAVFNNAKQHINVYGDDIEVDYRGYEVTFENFIRVLTGRLPPSTPRSKRLLTDDRSNVLVYMTGHGGDGFLKFQDAEEISSIELADAFQQMWKKSRYHELLFIVDTCQAVSMYKYFYSPNIIGIGSSQVGEDSLSHHHDSAIGVYIIDRYTYYVLEFLEKMTPSSQKTMDDFFKVCPQRVCKSTPGVRADLFQRDPKKTLVTDFFGSVRNVEVSMARLNLSGIALSREGDSIQKEESKIGGKKLAYVSQFPDEALKISPDKEKSGTKFSFLFVIASSAFVGLAGVALFTRTLS
ncbi:putative GPI-anchor transamidase [Diadema antillarum]|uniref:putative GPI-anchor transamidase n=1 Tax=Diadema antillarum TaxID=105358 RepID=UPI003A852733